MKLKKTIYNYTVIFSITLYFPLNLLDLNGFCVMFLVTGADELFSSMLFFSASIVPKIINISILNNKFNLFKTKLTVLFLSKQIKH